MPSILQTWVYKLPRQQFRAMRILIEEYQYDVADVRDVLQGVDALENVEGLVSVHYVGYYYNVSLGDCVFILPKVMLKDVDGRELVFGKYEPRDIIDFKANKTFTEKAEEDFVYKFAVWIYRAIVVYKNDTRNDSSIVYQKKIAQAGRSYRRQSNTFLDILLALIQFNKDNQNFFFFVLKNLHSGMNKINWTRTIATTLAIVQEDTAIYMNPVNKKRQINFDEELLVIFFSILNFIGDKYGFDKNINCNFPLIKGRQFERYLSGYGKVRLQQIKYKYFSDKALQLWQLCYAFFDMSRQVFVNTDQKEYLLVKSFHIVFEAIIDALIGDNPLPDGMDKKQDDGKIVDHLYTAKSLIENDNESTYYIGDSKYYKMGNELGRESIYKQYTYARNVIQWNLDIFNGESDKKSTSGIKLRDDETEGYNIIPNFFISARMDEQFRYDEEGIQESNKQETRRKSYQFKNRLFDRDTLLLFHYDVNFLFVLSLYARNNEGERSAWKTTQSLFSAFKEGNNVVVALTHLAAVQSRKDRGVFVDQCFGQRKDLLPVSVHLIESCRDISAHFNVLDLITADRNEISLENQNIRCHQDRIAKQAHGHVVVRIFACGFVGFYLCFIGMSSVHQAFGRHTVQNPVEFHRLRKIALTIKMHAFGIQSAGEPSRGNLNTALLNAIRIARLNQSMIVRQEVKTFRTFSPAFLDRRTNSADIISQMKCAAGRHTG